MTSVFIFNTSEQCCAVCMSSSGLHKVYQDGTGQLCSVPSPSTVPQLPPHSSVPLLMNTNCLISRGGAQDVSHHSSINLNWIIQNTAKYLQIKMNIARPGAGADLEPAERRQNSIILIRNSGLFFCPTFRHILSLR